MISKVNKSMVHMSGSGITKEHRFACTRGYNQNPARPRNPAPGERLLSSVGGLFGLESRAD